MIKRGSQRIFHIGINLIIAPVPDITPQRSLSFQQAIISQGLEYEKVEYQDNRILLTRSVPSPLNISVGKQQEPLGQLLVISTKPKGSFELFIKEVEATIKAFESVWQTQIRQIIRCDTTLRVLFETTSEHAFQELWERRLGQTSQSLESFGRPIIGGGLRFVMAPLPDEGDPIQIEIKIESFLRDTSKLFIETQLIWIKPATPGDPFNVKSRLNSMKDYLENKVISFLLGDTE